VLSVWAEGLKQLTGVKLRSASRLAFHVTVRDCSLKLLMTMP